jgi:endonuclease/exonuclease/phosphatase family metal-dependent hydrolase
LVANPIDRLGDVPMQRPGSADSFVEFGKAGERGVAVAARGEWSVRPAELPAIDGVVIGGVEVDGPVPFHLIAVWACLSGKPKTNPVIEALGAWGDWTSEKPLVVAGDFNTGGSWQEIRTGPMSHFPIVERLAELGLRSSYHAERGTDQGAAEEPTHWHSHGGKFMIDHIFTPSDWPIRSVMIGSEDPWRQWSDHAPIVVDITPQPPTVN